MIETILVTGATGTVGSEVVNQLSKEDKKVINIRAAFHSQNKVDNLKQVVGNEKNPICWFGLFLLKNFYERLLKCL